MARITELFEPRHTPNATFTYDNNGSTLTKADSSGVTSYAWDYENRLTSVTLPGTGGTVTFKYDPFGRRIQKIGASGTTNYAYDGTNVVSDLDATGTVLARYAQGSGIDEPLGSITAAGAVFFEADGLGSITSLTDAAGAFGATYTFNAFGNLTASSGAAQNPFRYTARELDQDTGLYYYRARYYDPQIGRFISEDPIRFDGGGNFYAYVSNGPTGLIDPYGTADTCTFGTRCGHRPDYQPPPKNPDTRSPDYYQCQCSLSPNCTKGWAGPSFTIEIDRYGNVYAGPGPSVGPSKGRVSCSCTANWIGSNAGATPKESTLQNFLTGPSRSVTAGWGIVGQYTWSGGTGGPGIGIGTPQAGGGYTYSVELQSDKIVPIPTGPRFPTARPPH